jgi:hypothetical protein
MKEGFEKYEVDEAHMYAGHGKLFQLPLSTSIIGIGIIITLVYLLAK